MSDKYQNKYRIPSARLQTWNYGNNGSYFITICTQNREHYFGEIADDEMQLNEIGKLAEQYWIEIPIHFPFIELGNFVVMPNHVHGILIINKNETKQSDSPIGGSNVAGSGSGSVETLQCNVSTTTTTTNATTKNEKMANISPKPGTISTIIRSYKSVVSKNAHLIHSDFEWQTRFHDHIIRNAESFERIQNYIADNPKNWKDDKFYS